MHTSACNSQDCSISDSPSIRLTSINSAGEHCVLITSQSNLVGGLLDTHIHVSVEVSVEHFISGGYYFCECI